MSELNGLLVVDKPAGWTSHDVVNKIRNMLGRVKTGHTGTLDPFATGVLIVLIGGATKAAMTFEQDDKRYLAEITFGYSTDTYDCTGNVKETGDTSLVELESLRSLIDGMHGEQEQYPPMYSAVKVNGKKLYQLARKGIEIERKPKLISIRKIEADITNFPKINLDIECSKGTYIRTIADTLGRLAGCPAHLSALRRTASGKFKIENAINFSEIVEKSDKAALINSIQGL